MFRAPRELVHRLAGERLVHRHIVQLAELKMYGRRKDMKRGRKVIKRDGTHNVQYVCCEAFVLKDGMTPDSAASLAQRKDMCRVLPGGGVRGEG